MQKIMVSFNDEAWAEMVTDRDVRIAALESEVVALRDPWQTIDPADPGTLPEPGDFFMISFRDKDGDCFTMGAYHYHDNEWYYHDDLDDVIEIYDEVYAWQPWPDPAPYPGKETQ